MPLPVFTGDLVQALDGLEDDHTVYLDPHNGALVRLSSEDESYLTFEVDDDTPGWQAEHAELVRDVLGGHRWLELPSQFDLDEIQVMKSFIGDMMNNINKQRLKVELGREMAYSRFHAALRRMRIEHEWEAFREESLAEVAKAWLQANRVPYTTDSDG